MRKNKDLPSGVALHSKGYLLIRTKGHHRADQRGYVFEHILIAEKILGRPIGKEEAVHHIDGDKRNNLPSNLLVLANNTEHKQVHLAQKAELECGNSAKRKCTFCKKYDDINNMYFNKTAHSYRHRECWKKYYAENKEQFNKWQNDRRRNKKCQSQSG